MHFVLQYNPFHKVSHGLQMHFDMVVGRYANFCFHKDVFTDFAL